MKWTSALFFVTIGSTEAALRRHLAACTSTFQISTADGCNFDALVAALTAHMATVPACAGKTAEAELTDIFGSSDVEAKATELCLAAYEAKEIADGVTFEYITKESTAFVKEYFDGNGDYNSRRFTTDLTGSPVDYLEDQPGRRIEYFEEERAPSSIFTWPEITNFEECELRASMCCFVQDRQARDGNGNCGRSDCEDADPGDNTDVCYVEMDKNPDSPRVTNGFAIYDGDNSDGEGKVHCHGFAWANDPTDKSAVFKANNLFFVSLYDHLTQRGYVKNVPGAPMCGCIEKAPIVSRSDCTQIDGAVTAAFSYDGVTLSAEIETVDIEFNACQGVDREGNEDNNDLESYYRQLVIDGKASQEELGELTTFLAGDSRDACPAKIASFVAEKYCPDHDPDTCGCKMVLQKDYRGTKSTTLSGRTCQRWDAQEPQSHRKTDANYPASGLEENYCRNPDGEPDGAWCYTTDPRKRWEYCGIPNCGHPAPPEAGESAPGVADLTTCGNQEVLQADYVGTHALTVTGRNCQEWTSQTPHSHTRTPERNPDKNLVANYCRNPDGEPGGAWCYTTDPNKRWEYCGIPNCG